MTSFCRERPVTCKQAKLCEFWGKFGSKAREKNEVRKGANLQWLKYSHIPIHPVFS